MLHTLGTLQLHVGKSGRERDSRITKWGCVISCRNNPQTNSLGQKYSSAGQDPAPSWCSVPCPKATHFALVSTSWMELRTGGEMEKKIKLDKGDCKPHPKSAGSIQRGISERFPARGSSGKGDRSPVLHWGRSFYIRTGAEH